MHALKVRSSPGYMLLLCATALFTTSRPNVRHWQVMGDLYASAIGTTVVQLKEIPTCPTDMRGALCLFDLQPGVDELRIREAFEPYEHLGAIKSIEIGGWPPAVVRLATHDAALAIKAAAVTLTHICAGIDTLYNEHPYDGRGW